MKDADDQSPAHRQGTKSPSWLRVFAVLLLLTVAYIHLGLFLRMISFHITALGILLGINALAAVISAVAIWFDRRWVGWILGSVVAGLAGIIRLAMDLSPSLSASILGSNGFRSGSFAAFAGKHYKGFKGFKGHFPAGFRGHFHPGAVAFHAGGLPAIPDAATLSIVIEFVLVALAIYALVRRSKSKITE